MSGNKLLDVREIDKRFRKKIILNLFSELKDEHELELLSDHSLAPLNKLFQYENMVFLNGRTWKTDLIFGKYRYVKLIL